MAMIHLMHGFIASGKTTYAKQLEKHYNALRLTSDEWVSRLYGSNPPEASFADYATRVRILQWELALRVIEMGKDVVFDYGFWSLADRNHVRAELQQRGIPYRFYALQASYEEMRARCLARTEALPKGELVIDANAFDMFWKRFEPMTEEEVAERVRV